MMTSALNDEDLALSINPSHSLRNFHRSPSDSNAAPHAFHPPHHYPHPPNTARPLMQKTTQQRLGQYKILETLGEGSFGKVKLAVHQVTGQKVALKIISRRKLMARDMAGRIEREIQYLQLLRHPHIIKLYTVITTSAEIIMVLEYAGSELFQYIVDHGKMVEDKARQFFQQIVCAVEYCHRHKIVHRDLKPENLLLDENLHVKITDFGLSNIMTDGNFLKTSCGSPNYAAPEVISGKLYAGPEVDVWSCGVILYVLLVGRLPFDDEYIPALFKKIAQGNYHVPHYLSPGAVRLIRKMLQISPVHRITVQEIRQDPWFVKDLAEYLQPPVEEFLDTGVDPNKSIDPHSLAPTKPHALQEKIHESVVGKLGKTMGYGRDDVQQALAIDEPNAIKDAYLIVRENQIMKETPSIAKNPAFQPFLAQSPPTYSTQSPISAITESPHGRTADPSEMPHQPERHRQGSTSTTQSGVGESRSPVNTIGVLPSSLPDYHEAFMKGQPPPDAAAQHERDTQYHSPHEKQTPEQQAATARRLKPHSRSQLGLDKLNKPEGMTPIQTPQKRPKQTKWQFGIRSRNQPAEAMLAIYKALAAMGAEWEIPKIRHPGSNLAAEDIGSISGSDDSSDESEDERDEAAQHHSQGHEHGSNDAASTGSWPRGRRRLRRSMRYDASNDWGYEIPVDPWVINARFRKDNLFPPGVHHPNSAHSSRIDLNRSEPPSRHPSKDGMHNVSAGSSAVGSATALSDHGQGQDAKSRRSSTISGGTAATDSGSHSGITTLPTSNSPTEHTTNLVHPTAAGIAPLTTATTTTATNTSISTTRSHTPPSSLQSYSRPSSRKNLSHYADSQDSYHQHQGRAEDSVYVYMSIQLYSIEKEFYLVDFKCAGYEKLTLRNMVKDIVGEAFGAASTGQMQHAGDLEGSHDSRDSSLMSQLYHGKVEDSTRSGGGGGRPEQRELVGEGRAAEEKDVSSPFPFLDVASRLIIQLAEAD